MAHSHATTHTHSFPSQRPNIRIERLDTPPFKVDCPELRWWFAVPSADSHTRWGIYDPPTWSLTSVTELQTTGPAQVHDIDGYEIAVHEWTPQQGWHEHEGSMIGRLTETAVEWLAVSLLRKGKRYLRTFLDEDFAVDWNNATRKIEAMVADTEGGYQQVPANTCTGVDVCLVHIGDKDFSCLRVLDVGQLTDTSVLIEAFITREGRTVLCRRYNSLYWGRKPGVDKPWDETLPDAAKMVINGVTFVHWYDCLTDLALS